MLPVIRRELRVVVRRPRSGIPRLLVPLLVAAYIGSTLGSQTLDGRVAGLGIRMLLELTALASFVFAVLAVITLAGSVSQDRRDGTLQLLWLSRVPPVSYALGIYLARCIPLIQGWVATLPFLALPMLLGGVTLGQVVNAAGTCLAVLLTASALCLAASSWSDDEPKAVIWGALLVGAYAILPLVYEGTPFSITPPGAGVAASPNATRGSASLLHPFFMMSQRWPILVPPAPALLLAASVCTTALIVACAQVRRVSREPVRPATTGNSTGRQTLVLSPSAEWTGRRVQAPRAGLNQAHPVAWLVRREVAWLAVSAGSISLIAVLLLWRGTFEFSKAGGFGLSPLWPGRVLLYLAYAGALEGLLAGATRSGLLQLVLGAAMPEEEVRRAFRNELVRWFAPAFAVVSLVQALVMGLGSGLIATFLCVVFLTLKSGADLLFLGRFAVFTAVRLDGRRYRFVFVTGLVTFVVLDLLTPLTLVGELLGAALLGWWLSPSIIGASWQDPPWQRWSTQIRIWVLHCQPYAQRPSWGGKPPRPLRSTEPPAMQA